MKVFQKKTRVVHLEEAALPSLSSTFNEARNSVSYFSSNILCHSLLGPIIVHILERDDPVCANVSDMDDNKVKTVSGNYIVV